MALANLPHMSEGDLELFFKESASELNATPSEMDSCRLRRRRRSVEMMSDEAINESILGGEEMSEGLRHRHVAKVTVIGDDTAAKLELCSLLMYKTNGSNSSVPQPPPSQQIFDIVTKTVKLDNDSNLCETEVWVPHVSSLHSSLRSEQYYGTHCFVIVFSIKDRASFDNIQRKWKPEIDQYMATLREEWGGPAEEMEDLPIVLVATDAEARNANVGLHSVVVPSREAVQVAQEIGAAKYIESYSGNEHHAKEVLHQGVEAVVASRSQQRIPNSFVVRQHTIYQSTFLRHGRAVPARGTFDLVQRTLSLAQTPDTTYYFTIDGSDPLNSATSTLYTRPIEFSRPCPKYVKVIGRSRCRYCTEVTEFVVPQETPVPSGYFDVNEKSFVAQPPLDMPNPVDALQIRYTLDGSEPNAKSAVYNGPLRFDGSRYIVGGPWMDGRAVPPKVIKLIAIGAGMFCSKSVFFESPAVLPEPRVQYNANDGTLQVETSSHLEYRYTLDGSVPTCSSTLYVRPVMLPRDSASLKTIRVACFPKPLFPSKEVVIDVRQQVHRDPYQRTIHTTKTAIARSQAATSRRQEDLNRSLNEKGPVHVAPGSRTASPTINSRRDPQSNGAAAAQTSTISSMNKTVPNRSGTPNRSGGNNNSTSAAAAARPRPASMNVDTTTQRRQAMREQAQQRQSPGVHKPSTQVGTPPPSATSKNNSNASRDPVDCEAKDNTVNFNFEDPISLSHITVSTPGAGKGPSTYEVRVQHRNSSEDNLVVVGSGELEDLDGIQTMHILPSARVIPVVKVQCAFLTSHGGLFQVNDMKVHGKPFIN